MVTNNIAVVKTTTISPNSSFVKNIIIEGTDVKVLLQNDRTYHYKVSPELAKQIVKKAKDKKSMGKVFNQWLRGSSVAKTIPA